MSLDNLPVEWLKSSFAHLNDYRANNFNPLKNDETYYELYSVPIFPEGYPEILKAKEIGSSKQIVEKNDVLLCKINPRINRVWQVSKHTDYLNIASSEWIVFRQGNVVPKFYRYYFQSLEFRNLLCSNVSGVGGSLTRAQPKHVATYDLPVPPLAEQQEIVRQLDLMLAQVEQIKARLDAIPLILKKFRQSVLADAVSGKLTEEWRNSNEKILDLNFESYIADYRIQKYLEWEKESLLRKSKKIPSDEILLKKYKPTLSEEITQDGLPNGWSRQLLDGLIYISARIGWKGLKAEEYTQEGPLFLSVHGLNYGKVVRLDQAFHISQERFDESPEIALKNDDILLCKDGAGIGKVGIVKGLDEPASINSSLLLIRSGEIFVPEFLYYVFKGPYIQKLVQERLTGTAIPHLFQRDIKEFLLDLPPLDEQKIIVETVEAYFDWVGKIEETVQSAQKRVNLLTQSILAKAFSGELTAEWREQHQDLITGVNSAEALLAKIQVEREASKPVKKAKKVK